MFKKEIVLPKALYELHGPRARVSSLLLVYLAGLLVAAIFIWQTRPFDFPLWKVVLLGIIVLDIAAGVVANLSTSTNQYYQQQQRSVRVGFLLLHILQPVALALVFPQHLSYFLYLFLFTIPLALLINAISDVEHQQNLAAFCVVLGSCGAAFFHLDAALLYLIAPLYMLKLLLGFSVARPAFTSLDS